MKDDEKDRTAKPPGWDQFNDAFAYGMGLGRGFIADSLRQAHQAGILGGGPPPTKFPEPFPLSDPRPRAPQDVADEKIAELERRVRGYAVQMNLLDQAMERLRAENRRLRLEADQLRMEKSNTYGVPGVIKKYLKFLIFACHPDRNPGRAEALEVTKALLNLRKG